VPKVEFEREGIVVDAPAGQTLLEVAETAGIEVFRGIWPGLHCGKSRGWCNRCKVWVHAEPADAVNPPTATERGRLRLNGRVSGSMRLACQVQLRGDVRVHTRAGGPGLRPSLVAGAPEWKNALSRRPPVPKTPKAPVATSAPIVSVATSPPVASVVTEPVAPGATEPTAPAAGKGSEDA
jgi:ferredoxin